MASAPCSPRNGVGAGGWQEGVARHHPCHAEGSALGECPGQSMVPTKPSTTVAAAGETRVCLS